jgi:hypothetical protein
MSYSVSRGTIIAGNNIKLISKIILKYSRNLVEFSCGTPICVDGYILKDKQYNFKLFLPKKIFHNISTKTFHGVHCDERIRIKICDIIDTNAKLYAYFHISDKISTHCNMYSIDVSVCSDVTICNPVIFICGPIIKKQNVLKCISIKNNNACVIQLFITESNGS